MKIADKEDCRGQISVKMADMKMEDMKIADMKMADSELRWQM